ncbi:hypothetical protein HKX48_003507 [Thoreauomyces humboldtii]|nr:hypothetical protein HKX48_003507 [Thoreauomyces humboldtii]
MLDQVTPTMTASPTDITPNSSFLGGDDFLADVLGVMNKHEEDATAKEAEKLRQRQDSAFKREEIKRAKYAKRQSFVLPSSPGGSMGRRASDAPPKKVASPAIFANSRRASVDVRRPSLDHRNTTPNPSKRKSIVLSSSPSQYPPAAYHDVRRSSCNDSMPLAYAVSSPYNDPRWNSYFPPPSPQGSPPAAVRIDRRSSFFPQQRPMSYAGAPLVHPADSRRASCYEPLPHEMGFQYPFQQHPQPLSRPTIPTLQRTRRDMHRVSMSFPPSMPISSMPSKSQIEEEDEDDDVPLALLPASSKTTFGNTLPRHRPLPQDHRRYSMVSSHAGAYPGYASPHDFPSPPVTPTEGPLVAFSTEDIKASKTLQGLQMRPHDMGITAYPSGSSCGSSNGGVGVPALAPATPGRRSLIILGDNRPTVKPPPVKRSNKFRPLSLLFLS